SRQDLAVAKYSIESVPSSSSVNKKRHDLPSFYDIQNNWKKEERKKIQSSHEGMKLFPTNRFTTDDRLN
ncbi:hypothetical protein K0M31_011660, partial [Melipona bicolor]